LSFENRVIRKSSFMVATVRPREAPCRRAHMAQFAQIRLANLKTRIARQ
jgi:hypothetical protein